MNKWFCFEVIADTPCAESSVSPLTGNSSFQQTLTPSKITENTPKSSPGDDAPFTRGLPPLPLLSGEVFQRVPSRQAEAVPGVCTCGWVKPRTARPRRSDPFSPRLKRAPAVSTQLRSEYRLALKFTSVALPLGVRAMFF